MISNDLSRLAAKFGTDKFGYHLYTPVYNRLLEQYRGRSLRVLEIGVGGYGDADRGGQSLAMWRDYFPQASVVGIDIQPKNFSLGPRVTILRGSQIDPEFLVNTVRDHGPFDIIIDDGSHMNAHVVESFGLLYPTLVPGGAYLVEDVQTSFFPNRGGSIELTHPNSVGFFRDYFADLAHNPAHPIDRVMRFHNIVALFKPPTDPAQSGRSFVGTSTRRADAAGWRKDFGGLADLEALHLPLAAQDKVSDELLKLYVDLDHREIALHFPDYQPDPLCREVFCVERDAKGIHIVKGRNDYPSNHGFDVDHPEAQEVRQIVESVLADDPTEGGLVAYATLMSIARGMPAARPYIDKLEEMGSTSGTYFRMAVALAGQDGDTAKALDLNARAVANYPNDADFLISLANAYQAAGSIAQCIEMTDRAIQIAPTKAKYQLSGARIFLRIGELDRAIHHGRIALSIFPPDKKAPVQEFLALALGNAGDHQGALEHIEPLLSVEGPRLSARMRLASRLYRMAGDKVRALETAESAHLLAPEMKERAAWLTTIRKWTAEAD